MLAALDAALLGFPSSKLGLLVAEALGGCAVGFCTLGLGETRGSEDGGADVRLQLATIPNENSQRRPQLPYFPHPSPLRKQVQCPLTNNSTLASRMQRLTGKPTTDKRES